MSFDEDFWLIELREGGKYRKIEVILKNEPCNDKMYIHHSVVYLCLLHNLSKLQEYVCTEHQLIN